MSPRTAPPPPSCMVVVVWVAMHVWVAIAACIYGLPYMGDLKHDAAATEPIHVAQSWMGDDLHTDPLVLHIDPLVQHIDPLVLHTDPLVQHIDPLVLHIDPLVLHTDPTSR